MNAPLPLTPAAAWTLDHVGHAVRDIEAAIRLYTETFRLALEVRETLPEHLVEAAFLGSRQEAGAAIELLCPLPGNKLLEKFLTSRGPGLHHICFRVPSIEAELERLTAAGVALIDKVPRVGSRNSQIAFIHPSSTGGILVELCTPRAAGA